MQDNSPFFKAALSKKWNEGTERPCTIELPKDQVDIVAAYVDYLYVDDIKAEKTIFSWLAHLYCFGEKIQDDGFCDALLLAIRSGAGPGRFSPGIDTVNIIYAGTPKNAPMRRFLVELYAQRATAVSQFPENTCSEFLRDLVVAMCNVRPAPWVQNRTALPAEEGFKKKKKQKVS